MFFLTRLAIPRGFILLILGLFCATGINSILLAETISKNDSILNQKFEQYRKNLPLLRTFMRAMPKGGDLHHHFAGAVYPEYFVQTLIRENLYIQPHSLEIKKQLRFDDVGFVRVQQLIDKQEFEPIRERLLKSFSARSFLPSANESNADFFFNTFFKFGLLSELGEMEDLLSLKKQAISEQVYYLETMFSRPQKPQLPEKSLSKFDKLLHNANSSNANLLTPIFTEILDSFQKYGIQTLASTHAQHIHQQHEQLALDDNFFTIRYLNYALRTQRPSLVFWDLAIAFISATQSNYIVGVNLVGPEHNSQALADYSLHMQMCNFLRKRFPKVNLSLHAGELSPKLATPLDLKSHITQAVRLAKAQRIGHGIDISYEENARQLLEQMARDSIAIEINLSSNDFILSVNKDAHPISLYQHYHVPIVISTDDPGILRSTLSEEYVKLARLYPQFKYSDIKQIVFNSIKYSFLPSARKDRIFAKMQRDFQNFEAQYLK